MMVAMVLAIAGVKTTAQLPPDFPQMTVLPNTNPAPGYLFGSVNAGGAAGKSNYFAILDNSLNPILLNKTNSLGKLACNGLFLENAGKKGQAVSFVLKDSSFNVVKTYIGGNGYNADNHDFEVLPNGHAIVECADNTPTVDMSKLVPGGFPAALPTEFIIQEVDVEGNVVFEWKSLDHIPVTDSLQTLTGQNIGDYIHVNSVWFDETDGTILLSCRNTSEVIKISRVTGEVVWRMGTGFHNQFTFTNGIPGNTDPPQFQVQHNARRLPNGRFTVFDNGWSDHSDPAHSFQRPYTRGAQYVLNETTKTATLVWEFRHNPDIIDYQGGTYQWLPGGHGIVQWGGANGTATNNAMSEADENGNLVADAIVQSPGTGGFTRMLWPLESTYVNVTKPELYSGDDYVFTSNGTNVTGVTMHVTSRDGDDYNSVTVSRQPFAPVLPRFNGKAPRVEPFRVIVTQSAINSLAVDLSFDAATFGFRDPTNTTVYYRQTPGQGLFVPLDTLYNWVTHQVEASVFMPASGSNLGEFIFGWPDLAEVPYPPLLKFPPQDGQVNQNLPVPFLWTSKGFAQSYYLQVSTNADFSTLLVDEAYVPTTRYTNAIAPGTRYYWRVQTSNYGGNSDWATNTFTTVPPMVQMVVPNGGEAWQRGLSRDIQWSNNVTENVALDLYKAGFLIKTITTNSPGIPAYRWSIPVNTVLGSDYSIRIRSTTNAALFDLSDATFSIVDAPAFNSSSAVVLANGSFQIGLTAPGAATATVLVSTNLTTWQALPPLPLTNGIGLFTDDATTNSISRFYRLSVP